LAWCLVQVRPKGPRTRGWSGINSYLTPVALVTRNLGLLESPNNVLGRPSRVRVNAVAHRSGWFPVGQGQKGRSGKMGGLRGDAAQSRLERHHSAAVGPALFPLLRTAAPIHPDGSARHPTRAEAAVLQLTAKRPTCQPCNFSTATIKPCSCSPSLPERRPRVKFPPLAPARLEGRVRNFLLGFRNPDTQFNPFFSLPLGLIQQTSVLALSIYALGLPGSKSSQATNFA
jgi:hypothetical protein